MSYSANKYTISVITPWWDHEELLQYWSSNIAKLGSAELIFIDNGSAEPAKSALEEFARDNNVKLIRNEKNLGFAAANNQGAAIASGEYLLHLNDDVVINELPLDKLCELTGNGIAGPASNQSYSNLIHYVEGWALCIKKSTLAAIGGWSEEYGPGYWEDVDLCLAAQSRGLPVIAIPEFDKWILHLKNVTGCDGRIDQTRIHRRNLGYFLLKNMGWRVLIDLPDCSSSEYPIWLKILQEWEGTSFGKLVRIASQGIDPQLGSYDTINYSELDDEVKRSIADDPNVVALISGRHADIYKKSFIKVFLEWNDQDPSIHADFLSGSLNQASGVVVLDGAIRSKLIDSFGATLNSKIIVLQESTGIEAQDNIHQLSVSLREVILNSVVDFIESNNRSVNQEGISLGNLPQRSGVETNNSRAKAPIEAAGVVLDISVLGLGQQLQKAKTGIHRVVSNLLLGLVNTNYDVKLYSQASLITLCQEYISSCGPAKRLSISSDFAQSGYVFHSPYYPLPDEKCSTSRVLTIHDLLPIQHPEWFNPGAGEMTKSAVSSVRQDDFVIVHSESVKNELLNYSKIPSENIYIAPLAASPDVFYKCDDPVRWAVAKARYNIPNAPFYLSVATLEPRKNIASLLRAFFSVLNADPTCDLHLVLVGTLGWKIEHLEEELSRGGHLSSRVVLTGYVRDVDLATIYSHALAFVYPSLAEGFGLPPLEAMQCGVPVITSKLSSLPEVVGDAGILVDPYQVDEIADAMLDLLKNDQRRNVLSSAGLERSKNYSWEKYAAMNMAVYAMASSAPPPPTTFSLPNQENTRHVGPVLIDGVFFQLYRTGIGRVWKTLLEVWSRSEFSGRLIVIDRNRTAPRVPGINYVDMPAFDYDDASGDRFQLQKICDQYQAAVFISTYYTAPITTPSVILVHDMIPELFLDNPLDNPMWREKRYGLMHASQYITVSHNTANDLRRILPGIPEGRVTVAYNGVSLKYPGEAVIEDFKSRYNIKRPYFLMVGARKGYKNGELFFQAFRKLGTLRNKLAVVCTGPVKTLEADFAECLGGANVHMLEVDDSELEAVYAGAIALVYPSKYEGFGMPVVEAMACRCPVITTFAGSLREVAGDAALFVSEDNVVEMTKALKKVQAELVRKRLIESGLKRSSCFSWEKMADQVREVIGHIVSGFETKNKNRQLLSEEKQQLAMQYYSSGNFDEARKLLEKIHEADPDNFVVLHLLGSIYFLLKDWTRAEIMMLRAVHSDASVSETHSNLGGLYMNQGRLKEARRHLQKAISLNNELQVARDLLAHLDTIQAAV